MCSLEFFPLCPTSVIQFTHQMFTESILCARDIILSLDPRTRSAATLPISSCSMLEPWMPSWLASVNPSKALVQLVQPLSLLSRGCLSTKCLVNLWSGPWLSWLNIFLHFRQCIFYLRVYCEKERCMRVSAGERHVCAILFNSIIRLLLKPYKIIKKK